MTIGMAPYETSLYWDEVGERKSLEPEAINKMIEIVRQIKDKMKKAQSRQKSYADTQRSELHFEVGGKIFLKVAPTKGIAKFDLELRAN